MTRPDIQFAVNQLAQMVHNPSMNAMLGLKHLVRYLSRTRHAILLFPRKSSLVLSASSDSSWGSKHSPHGMTGNVFMIGNTPVAWWSKKQKMVATSTCEAEYEALKQLAVSAQWIRPLFNEIFRSKEVSIPTQLDNQAAILTAEGEKISARNRHFIMRQALVREAIATKLLKVVYTPSDEVIADGLTKALQRTKQEAFSKMLSMELFKH